MRKYSTEDVVAEDIVAEGSVIWYGVSVKIAAEIVVSEEIGVNCGFVRIIETKVDGAGVENAAEKGLSGMAPNSEDQNNS